MSERVATMSRETVQVGTPAEVHTVSNDALVLRLHYTINHLSRWLTPIHEPAKLTRVVRRGEASVKDLLIRMRDEELRIFPKLHLISVKTDPDLDKLPYLVLTPEQVQRDATHTPLSVMAEFRRLRQSTCSLLRSLPDDAWARTGSSRREHTWTLRALAEVLLDHDYRTLAEMDETLDRTGAREGIAAAQCIPWSQLVRLDPVDPRR